jgi:hypothetical protein
MPPFRANLATVMKRKKDPAQRINPRSVDPETGELYDPSEQPTPKRTGLLHALKRAATDAAMRRVSTKR